MNFSHIISLMLIFFVCSCDKLNTQKAASDNNIDSSHESPSLSDTKELVPFEIKVSQHVAAVLKATSEEHDITLREIFLMQGIIFNADASTTFSDETTISGELLKKELSILKQLLIFMEEQGEDLTIHNLIGDDHECF